MKDYYGILEVSNTASLAEIKAAFKKLSLLYRSDQDAKNSADQERVRKALLVNEAYEVLKDEEKRKEYDKIWNILYLTDEVGVKFKPAGYLTFDSKAFSEKFKQEHKHWLERFTVQPKATGDLVNNLKSWQDKTQVFIGFLQKLNKRNNPNFSLQEFSRVILTPDYAIQFLEDFLNAKYGLTELKELLPTFKDKVVEIKRIDPGNRHIDLYEGVLDILRNCVNYQADDSQILASLYLLTAYTQDLAQRYDASAKLAFAHLTKIFASQRFRDLYILALFQYWNNPKAELETANLWRLDGSDQAKKSVNDAKERITSAEKDQPFIRQLRVFHTNRKFECHNSEIVYATKLGAECYREKAYWNLDWVPAFAGFAPIAIIVNTILQAGIWFQKAAQEEKKPAIKMADERMAFGAYLQAYSFADKCTPDVKLSLTIHIVRLLSQLTYVDNEMQEIYKQLIDKALHWAELYPFASPYQSNAVILAQETQPIAMLRQYLHALLAAHEKNSKESKVYDLNYVDILYQVYEACLLNWFEMEGNAKQEKIFRQKLMVELLRINHWTLIDVEKLLKPTDAVTVLKDDAEFWSQSGRYLSFPGGQDEFYQSVKGIEIDYKNAQIILMSEAWSADQRPEGKLLGWKDVYEIFSKKVCAAEFSLDPPDPNKPYHPFNQLQFAPSRLHATRILHTMLMADLLLKYLTVKKQVQTKPPFEFQDVEAMLKQLPIDLRKIILDLVAANQSDEAHRFWIAVDELAISEVKLTKSDMKDKVALGKIRMCVKKHRLVRDAQGKLVDKEQDDEGWDFYVIKKKDLNELKLYLAKTKRPAIIWIDQSGHFCLYENGNYSNELVYSNPILPRLYKLPCNEQGKVTLVGVEDELLIYDLTKCVTFQTKKPHNFSDEYIFAQEFTKNYDRFALYFPILARLRELSKVVLLTRIMEIKRLNTQEMIKDIDNRLNDYNYWQERAKEIYSEVESQVISQLSNLRKKSGYHDINERVGAMLKDISNQMGTMRFTQSSPEIISIYEERLEEIKHEIIRKHGYQAWNANSYQLSQTLQNQLPELAEQMTRDKFDAVLPKLVEIFRERLSNYNDYSLTNLVTEFMTGKPNALRLALIAATKFQIAENIHSNIYPSEKIKTIIKALDHNQASIAKIVQSAVNWQIEHAKELDRAQKQQLIKLVDRFSEMGLAQNQPEVDLSRQCLWVPASIDHNEKGSISRLTYGGVQIAGRLTSSSNASANSIRSQKVYEGQTVYRVWDGDRAKPFGRSWTNVNPATLANPRCALGLPNEGNKGRFVTEGKLVNKEGVWCRSALPLDGNKGGCRELIIPNAKQQVKIVRVSGVNPEI